MARCILLGDVDLLHFDFADLDAHVSVSCPMTCSLALTLIPLGKDFVEFERPTTLR